MHDDEEFSWQRPALAILSGAGLLDTTYLLFAHMARQSLACPQTGLFHCDAVVNSPYSSVLGLPLAAWGFGAYLTVLLLTFFWSARTRFVLRMVATAMAITGGFLLFLMLAVLNSLCLYCLISLILSAGLAVVSFASPGWKRFRQEPLFVGIGLAALIVSAIALAPPGPVETTSDGKQLVGLEQGGNFAVTTSSGPSELALATHLAGRGARMYGGFMCSHCHREKQLFGAQAFSAITYVECDPRSPYVQQQACDSNKIGNYPTWLIDGVRLEGEQDLDKLADASGYTGPRDFMRRIRRS